MSNKQNDVFYEHQQELKEEKETNMVYARIRRDLRKHQMLPATKKGWLPKDELYSTFRAYQPEELDNEQFNTKISSMFDGSLGGISGRHTYYVNSLDLDFYETKKEASIDRIKEQSNTK